VDHIYLGSTGKDNYANVVLAEALRLAITLGLHDENIAIQQGLDAIEKETRRRVFWVLCEQLAKSFFSVVRYSRLIVLIDLDRRLGSYHRRLDFLSDASIRRRHLRLRHLASRR